MAHISYVIRAAHEDDGRLDSVDDPCQIEVICRGVLPQTMFNHIDHVCDLLDLWMRTVVNTQLRILS